MQSYSNGRDLLRGKCFIAYILYLAVNLRPSIGHIREGNVYNVCGNTTIYAQSGTLHSSNFPDFYDNQETCVTNISIESAFLIEITFEVFQTESVSNLNLQNEMCVLDYIEIVANHRSMRICGDWTGKERLLYFIFITSFISIKFHSNAQNSNQGFALKWSSTSARGTNPVLSCEHSLLETATSCFEIITKPEDWVSGHETCRRRGASLAKIEDIQTHSELETRLYNSKFRFYSIWIGAHDRLFEGDYMWPDRSTIQFHNWFPGWRPLNENETHNAKQPSDDGYSNEDCVEIRTQFSYSGKGTSQARSFFWNDRNCNEKNPFICQYDKHRGKRSTDKVPLQCDRLLQLDDTRSNVIVTSPVYPNAYPALASCHTIVTAPIGKQLKIDFQHFDIEDGKRCEYDNLSVSELPMTNASRSVTRCGNWNKKLKLLRWTTEVNKVVIAFHSDNTKHFSGFSINVTLADHGNLCDEENSSISSLYGLGGCWVIVNGSKSFTEAEETCTSLGSYIADGKTENIHFAGDVLNVTDGCRDVWLNLGNSSNSSNTTFNNKNDSMCDAVRICGSQQYQGNILLEYNSVITQVPCSSLNHVLCQRPVKPFERESLEKNVTSESGNINTFNHDGKNYSNNQNLSFHFHAKEGFRILFEFVAYDIEYQDQCLYDYIETFGMTFDQKYCGKNTDSETFISRTNTAIIRLFTDKDITAAGFNLSWYWINNGEAFQTQIQTENLSSMYSVNYPKAFPDKIENCSLIRVPDDKRLLVVIEDINLPGGNCDDSSFEIISGADIKVFCGGTSLQTLSYFSRYVLTNSEDINICLKVPQLQRGEGVRMQLRSVPRISSKLSTAITLLPNQSMQFSSLMFPDMFPDETTQHVIFRTDIGYMINLSINFTAHEKSECSLDTLDIRDLSLTSHGDNLKLYSCTNLTADAGNWTTIAYSSVLNTVQLILTSGDHATDTSSINFSGFIASVQDPSYLNKTRQISGTFGECDNSTCKNGGNCEVTDDGRFTCICQSHYTGLFCQASKCDPDINPCHPKHGKCHLTSSGFMCNCETGYWGDRCTQNNILCQFKRCSGNGRCVSINETETGCLCDEPFTGPRCSMSVQEPEEELTIGQKLLKEPIWIGMIVILNLVFFFCVSYIIRRKCGEKIANMFPNCTTKTAVSSSKEDSKIEQSTTSFEPTEKHMGKDVYSVTLNTPSINTESRWSAVQKTYCDELDSISVPSTPVVTEDNQEAAMKLFAAYNTRKPDLSPNITSIQSARNNLTIKTRDIMSCGIQGGTVTLNQNGETENQTREPLHGILRSYTISTEIRDFESRISKARNEAIRKTSSYAGSPVSSRNTDFIQKSPKPKVRHCFPEIRIINEHNCEDVKLSDSDDNSDADIPVLNDVSQSKSVENIPDAKTSDQQDSGYPSTTISTTHDGSQIEDINLKYVQSASERRKLFSSKAKSASFYKISRENDVIKNKSRKETRGVGSSELLFKNSTSGDFQSFESEICGSCKRDKVERYAYSYEKDLDKIHRYGEKRRHMDGYSSTHSHNHKRHRRRRKCGCVKHHSYSKKIEFNSYDLHEPSVHLRRDQYLPSSMHQSHDNWAVRRCRHGLRPLNSSTESDSCLCSAHEMRFHPRQYVREAISEHDFRRRHDSAPDQDFNYSPRIDFRSDDSYKSKLMRSFLSDTYRENRRNHSGSENTCERRVKNKNFLCSPQNSSASSSKEKSRSPSPRGNNSLHRQRKRSATVVEVADDKVIQLDSTDSVLTESPQNVKRPFNSPSSTADNKQTKIRDTDIALDSDNDNSDCREDFTYPVNETNNSSIKFKQLPDVECVAKDNFNDWRLTQISESRNYVIDSASQPISGLSNIEVSLAQKDSAYQTKQSSIDKLKKEASIKDSNVLKSRRTDTTDSHDVLIRQDDKVQRHLHQAALKLALLKRLQARKSFSKDSAIHTFSEDDLSADDTESRGSFRPLVKRTSGILAFQLRETSLSQVQEEHSGVSRDTDNYNTPTNEPLIGSFDRSSADIVNSAIPLTDVSCPYDDKTSVSLEETKV